MTPDRLRPAGDTSAGDTSVGDAPRRGRKPNGGSAARLAGCVLGTALVCLHVSQALAFDPARLDGARKEGRVVWYTTQIIAELATPMAESFKAAFGIDVTVEGISAREMVARLTAAARSGRAPADVVDGRATVPMLKRQGLLTQWLPDGAKALPPQFVDPQGYWIACNVFMNSIAYNPEMVAPDDVPRSLDDLLKPIWSGRMLWSSLATMSGGPGFVGAILREKGDVEGRAYLDRLSRQQIAGIDVTSREILDQVIARDYPLALQVFNHQAAISSGKAAPLAWAALEPVTGSLSAVAIAKDAPHPHAARLFVEFLISRQGQELFRDADYLPADPAVPPKDPRLLPEGGKFRAVYFTPEEIEDQMPGWADLFAKLFR